MFQDNKTAGRVDADWVAPSDDSSTQINKGGKKKFYKPFVLWTSTLSFLLGVTLVLIAITELACHKLPSAANRGFVGSLNNRTEFFKEIVPRQLDERQQSPNPANPAITPPPTEGKPPESGVSVSFSTQINTVSGIEYTVVVDYEYGPSTPTPDPTTSSPPQTIESLSVDNSGVTYTKTITTIFPPPLATTTGGPPTKAWNKIGTRTIGTKITTIPTPEIIPVPGGVPVQNTNGPVDTRPTAATQPVTPVVTPATFIAVATTIVDTLGKAKVTTVPVALDSKGSTIVVASGLISADATTTFLRAPTGQATSTAKNGSVIKDGSDDGSGYVLHIFTMRDYLVGAFLPTVLAVLFVIPWALINAAAKEMEPIYQLAESGGASAMNSLSLNYVTLSMFVAPFRAFSRRHWMILITSVLALISLVTPPLAVETVFISLSGTCSADADSEGCIPTLSVFKKAARVLEAVLAFMAILLATLIWIAHKRSSSVAAEPLSLAGVASLMQNQEFLNIIRELPSHGVKEKALLSLLPPHSFKIGHFQNADATWGYGFMLSREVSSPNRPYMTSNTYANTNLNHHIDHDSIDEKNMNMWNRFSRIFQVIGFALLLLGLLVLVGFYRFVSSDYTTGFGRFMNNQQFGVKFLFTALGVVIAQFWAFAREIIHRNEPYHNLTKGSATAQNSILISPSLAPITSIFTSLQRFAPLLILLDTSTLLADLLIITLSNIPYSSVNTFEAWTICCYISLVILAFMIVTLFVVLVRIGRFGGSGQDVPSTLVGKCVLLCGSVMLDRFAGMGEMEGEERRRRIENWGTRFGAGRVTGVDGVVRRGVDFEECIQGGRGRN